MRFDGRKDNELRELYAKVNVIKNADGSALFKIGKTRVIAAVYGPRELHPRHLAEEDRAILRVYYDMIPFSVPERKTPGPTRRSIELSLVIQRALESMIFLEEFPKAVIDVYIHVLQADAGTRVASLTAASLALANAGIPMRDILVGIAVGKVGERIVLDLNKKEEDYDYEKLKDLEEYREYVEYYGKGKATDMPLAYSPKEDSFALLQMDGKVSKEDLEKMIKLGKKGCKEIYEYLRKVLRESYSKIEES